MRVILVDSLYIEEGGKEKLGLNVCRKNCVFSTSSLFYFYMKIRKINYKLGTWFKKTIFTPNFSQNMFSLQDLFLVIIRYQYQKKFLNSQGFTNMILLSRNG